jgi:hypothetical protein
MAKDPSEAKRHITPEMTVLDVINRCRQTETVFKKYDEQAGACICCESLFEPLENVAAKHGLNLKLLLMELEGIANADE